MFFFLVQFFQDVQRFSPLVAGVAFLPMPASVFLASQLTGRVLVRRLPQKIVMMTRAPPAWSSGLLLATRHPGRRPPYGQIVVSMVLIGAGMGISFVSLTSASLADVAPEDAGAASGLVNVSQQLGGALGLAVLVTAFDAVTGHAQLGSQHLTGAARHARQRRHSCTVWTTSSASPPCSAWRRSPWSSSACGRRDRPPGLRSPATERPLRPETDRPGRTGGWRGRPDDGARHAIRRNRTRLVSSRT